MDSTDWSGLGVGDGCLLHQVLKSVTVSFGLILRRCPLGPSGIRVRELKHTEVIRMLSFV